MALQRSAGFAIYVDYNPVWITWKVDAYLYFDLSHFFIDFSLQQYVL